MLASAWAADAAYAESGSEPAYDGYLVKFSDSLRIPQTYMDELDYVMPELFRTDCAALIKPLLDSGIVEYIEPNYCATLCGDSAAEGGTGTAASDKGWAYDAMQAAYAKNLGLDGSGVRIAIIDSGVNAANADLQSARIDTGCNFLDGTGDVSDDIGHGTRVSQMIAGADNGLGTTGIAPGAEIVPLKCFASGRTTSLGDLIPAIMAAADKYHCDVINMSWGIQTGSDTLDAAIDHALEKGAVCVAAAGNKPSATKNTEGEMMESTDNTILYPAACEGVIGVGSVDSNLSSADTSKKNATVDVCAPGNLLTFVDTATGANETKQYSGTSFASPCAAAAAALAKQANPSLTGADVTALFESRAEDLGAAGRDDAYGYGFVRLDTVFGSPWFRQSAAGGTLSVRGFRFDAARLQESGVLSAYAAMYSSAGRMAALQALSQTDGAAAVNITFASAPEGAAVKLFYLDANYAPVKAAETPS